MKNLAVIGLDGFDMEFDHRFLGSMDFVRNFIEEHGYKEIKVSSEPHSGPSWTTIFSGRPQEHVQKEWTDIDKTTSKIVKRGTHNVHGFYNFSVGEEWVTEKHEGDKPWRREMMDFDFVWDMLWKKKAIKAVAQGIMMIQPHYSNIPKLDKKAYYDGKYNSYKKAAEYCGNFHEVFNKAMNYYLVPYFYAGVLQIVDQIHHHYNQMPDWEHQKTMKTVDNLVEHIASKYDNIVLISDHGVQVNKMIEYNWAKVRTHGHRPVAFLASNNEHFNTIEETLDVTDAILSFFDAT